MESEDIGLMDLAAAGREYPQFGKSVWNTGRDSAARSEVACSHQVPIHRGSAVRAVFSRYSCPPEAIQP